MLQPVTTLTVSFLDQAGAPLPNLPVRVSAIYMQEVGFLEIPAAMRGIWEQKTNAKGECLFPGLPQGGQRCQIGFRAEVGGQEPQESGQVGAVSLDRQRGGPTLLP